jgi:hypothetical protein
VAMDEFDFLGYMLTCAQELKEILHSETEKRYFRISGLTALEELLFNLSDACYPAIMVIDNCDGNITDRSPSDNIIDSPYYSFMVIAKTDFADHDLIASTKESCKSIGLKIISRMVRDKRIMANGLTFLNVSSISYSTFGPVADGIYGVSFSFIVQNAAPVTFSASHWQQSES